MSKKNYWRGVKGVTMLWHGEWSDPELRYGNVIANIFDVEECLSRTFEEEFGVVDVWDDKHEEEFSQFCREYRDEVISYIYSGQTVENKFELLEFMMEKLTENLAEEEYSMLEEMAFANNESLFKEKGFDKQWMDKIREFNKEYGLEGLGERWWKYDYAGYGRGIPEINIRNEWDLIRWYFVG